jgi:hypothetical protein
LRRRREHNRFLREAGHRQKVSRDLQTLHSTGIFIMRLFSGVPGRRKVLVALVTVTTVFGGLAMVGGKEYLSGIIWPEPPVVDPEPVDGHPRDAIVLFGGKDMSEWNGGERWVVKDGVATARGGGVSTKRSFGDCQLHVEWASPEKVEGNGQGRGNSGVYLMGNYEVQILDSYNNPTYFDGQAGSLYKQSPPLVNASKKPGEWQTYDIFFKAPVFDRSGKVVNRTISRFRGRRRGTPRRRITRMRRRRRCNFSFTATL